MSTVSSAVEIITPEVAKVMLETMPFRGQRPLRLWHVDEIQDEIKRGNFAPGTSIQLACVRGQWVLIDGQHRLNAVARGTTPVQFSVIRHFDVTPQRAADLYGVTDRWITRTPYDDAVAHGLPEKLGLAKTQMNYLSAAVHFLLNNFLNDRERKISLSDRRNATRDWCKEFKLFTQITEGSSFWRVLRRSPVLSVALAIVRHADEDRYRSFWSGIATGNGLNQGDPRKALRSWLGHVGARVDNQRTRRAAPREEQARAVAQAWNAYYEDRSLSVVRVKDSRAPIVILGTPWDGINKD